MADRPATTSKTKKKPGRKRRVAAWLLLVIGVLITGVWGASGWWWPSMFWRTWSVEISRGGVSVEDIPTRVIPRPRWELYVAADEIRGWNWTFGYYRNAGGWNLWVARYFVQESDNVRTKGYWSFLLWPFALASLLGGGWLVWSGRRARRRAMPGVCLKCGYDLAGLAAGGGAPCPECGEAA